MRKTKKFVFTVLIIVYLLAIVPRQIVAAEELPAPSPDVASSPAPSTSPSPSDSPSPSPSTDSTAQNIDASPTPSPSPDPCDCPPVDITQTNTTDNTTNDTTVTADTGNNTTGSPLPETTTLEATSEATPSASPTDTPQDQASTDNASTSSNPPPNSITTGNAQVDAQIENFVNTNNVNSNIVINVQNIYLDQNGNILIDPGPNITPVSGTITQTNSATVNNIVTALANSGINTINSAVGNVTTGNAYAIVNVINFVNTNLVNSSWQFIFINIFGNVTGNIVLPELASNTTVGSASADTTQSNNGTVQNSLIATSNTGQNQTGGNVTTGNATTAANVQNVVNTNISGVSFYQLIVNTLGTWNGSFLGWGGIDPAQSTYGHNVFGSNLQTLLANCSCSSTITQTNTATVNNQISVASNTGGNNIYGNGNIQTGNAYTAVNLINFVNTNVVNSFGFFGIINIFGNLNGDIGGQSEFLPAVESAPQTNTQEAAASEVHSPGGQIESSISTNVGTHVNPGDTVMVYITAKNPGSGPLYDAKVTFNLIDGNGKLAALQNFNLGKLNPGQTAHISFGMQLKNTAPLGIYEVREKSEGKVGPSDETISSVATDSFLVGPSSPFSLNLVPDVLAADTNNQPTIDHIEEIEDGSHYPEPWGNLALILLFAGSIRMLQILYKKRQNEIIVEKDETSN